jgi:hypothetical protein
MAVAMAEAVVTCPLGKARPPFIVRSNNGLSRYSVMPAASGTPTTTSSRPRIRRVTRQAAAARTQMTMAPDASPRCRECRMILTSGATRGLAAWPLTQPST